MDHLIVSIAILVDCKRNRNSNSVEARVVALVESLPQDAARRSRDPVLLPRLLQVPASSPRASSPSWMDSMELKATTAQFTCLFGHLFYPKLLCELP